MLRTITLATAAALAAPAAFAQDPAAGEELFSRCQTCHSIVSPEGETVVRGGRQGPNLWGVIGRQAGTQEDFNRYGDSLKEAGEQGLVWTEEAIASYLVDPGDFLEEQLGGRARSMMAFRLREGGEDVAAYLAQFGAEEEAATN